MTGKHNLNRPDYERLIYLNMPKSPVPDYYGCVSFFVVFGVLFYLLIKFIFFY
jgi:hypothetical protein